MGLLRRRRLDDHLLELPVLASMRPRRVQRPGLENDFQGFVEALRGLLHGHAEAGELLVAIAHAGPEIEPALRQRVAACSASSTGLCQGRTITAVPSRSVFVRAAMNVRRLSVAEIWPNPVKWCSTRNVLQKPSDSASTL